MKAGDTVTKLVCLQGATGSAAGNGLSFGTAAAFAAAGWALTWYDTSGVALASQPTYTVAVIDGVRGVHAISFPLAAGRGYVKATVPSGYRSDPFGWSFDGQSYDDDAIAGLLQTNQGVPAVTSADDGDLGDIVWKDAWTSDTQTIPLGRLSRFGYAFSDLASGWTISAGFRQTPNGTAVLSGAGPGNGITAAFVAATSGTYKVSWDVYPTAMDMAVGDEAQVWYLDVQLKNTASGRLITEIGRAHV